MNTTVENGVDITLIICSLAYATVSLIAILGNIYGLIKIFRIIKRIQGRRTEKTPLRKANLHLLFHMSLSDLLAGLFAMPFTALTMMLSAVGYKENIFVVHVLMCNLSGFIQCTVCRMSLFLTMILVVIRALAIFWSRTVTHTYLYKIIQYSVYISWGLCVFISLTPFIAGELYLYNRNLELGWFDLEDVFGQNAVTVGYFLIDVIPFLIPGAIVIICTGIVLYGLRMLGKVETHANPKRSHSHYQATITTLMVAGTFLFCYGMWWITSLVVFFNMAGIIKSLPGIFVVKDDKLNVVFMLSHGFLVYLNSAINPILYHFRLFNKVKSKDGRSSVSSSMRKGTSILRNGSSLSKGFWIKSRKGIKQERPTSETPGIKKQPFLKTIMTCWMKEDPKHESNIHCMVTVNRALKCPSMIFSQDSGVLSILHEDTEANAFNSVHKSCSS